MSIFLENLKKAADSGEFNSDAAKKINQIDEKANIFAENKSVVEMEESLIDKAKRDGEIKSVSEEEALELNSQYEQKMKKIKEQDAVNTQLVTLIDIEGMVKASIGDMYSFIEELEVKFEKELNKEDPIFGDLYLKLEEIKSKYNPIVNN